MNLIKLLLFFAGAAVLLTSCNSSKIAYGNSYYFKQTPKYTSSAIEPVSSTAFIASTQAEVLPTAPSIHAPMPEKLTKIAQSYEQVEEQLEEAPLTRVQKKTLKKEKRALRKQLKKELKSVYKPENKASVAQEVTGLIKAGIIVGAAGAVMLAIGLLANVAFLTSLGGIFLAIGVVFILIKVL